MLSKKFANDLYQRTAPHYKEYQTDVTKESLLITRNYSVIKQGKADSHSKIEDYFLE
jgi:hypothetical protein